MDSGIDNVIAPMLEMIKGLVPTETFNELQQSIDNKMDEIFQCPSTVMHSLMELISGLEDQVDKSKLYEVIYRITDEAWAMWVQNEIKTSREENSMLEKLPGGLDMVDYIFKKISSSENNGLIIEVTREFVKNPKIVRWASSFSSYSLKSLSQMPFEKCVRESSNVLANLSETYYKDHLRVLYFISKDGQCKKVPNTLGAVVNHCNDFWKKEDTRLTQLLYHDLCILRNSVKHSNTDISIQNEQVTFIDDSGKIGPMGLLEYLGWWNNYMQNLLCLNTILRIVFRRYWMLFQMAEC